MAESVDALVSNTSGAIRAGSIPAPGTRSPFGFPKGLLIWFILTLELLPAISLFTYIPVRK